MLIPRHKQQKKPHNEPKGFQFLYIGMTMIIIIIMCMWCFFSISRPCWRLVLVQGGCIAHKLWIVFWLLAWWCPFEIQISILLLEKWMDDPLFSCVCLWQSKPLETYFCIVNFSLTQHPKRWMNFYSDFLRKKMKRKKKKMKQQFHHISHTSKRRCMFSCMYLLSMYVCMNFTIIIKTWHGFLGWLGPSNA